MKAIEWRDPNTMVFESGHKTFDRQVGFISPGNVISPHQLSKHVRAYADIHCNGFTRPPGHLRDFDLGWFDSTGLPGHMRRWLKRATQEQGAWVYRFCHFNSDGRRVVHGWVVTSDGPNKTLLRKFYTGPTYKSWWVIDEAAKYVSNPPGGQEDD
ncbi:MAG: hypothetical protein GWN58_01840 [Anaerolineae bacterium]|nr:hypothetical protein [Anaerolineae bacterium]